MTLVDATTGEILADISADDARDLTDRIKVTVEGAWHLIKQAYETRTWAALGYLSWDDYCTREFGGSRLRLPREERQEVVASLRDSGLSTRAIAVVAGVDQRTVRRDLDAGEANAAPARPPLSRCQVAGHGWHGAGPCPTDEPEKAPKAPDASPIKGTDGKAYSRPEPKVLTPAEQREIDIADGDRRSARAIEKLTDLWPYFITFHRGDRRAEVEAHFVQPTLDAIAKIEEALK